MSDFSVIGKSIAMVDAAGKTTGAGKYTDDFSLPGMLVGRILHSPYPHALIKRIDAGHCHGPWRDWVTLTRKIRYCMGSRTRPRSSTS